MGTLSEPEDRLHMAVLNDAPIDNVKSRKEKRVQKLKQKAEMRQHDNSNVRGLTTDQKSILRL